jgi:hypothetical protein
MNNRQNSHGQRLALLEKAATGASSVPVAASGSSGNLGSKEGGTPTPGGGGGHGDTTLAPGSGGTALGAGRRGGSASGDRGRPSGGGLGGPGGGGLGGQGGGGNRYGRRATFPPTMVRLIPYRGSTNVAHIFTQWGRHPKNACGWHPCTWRAPW